MWKKIIIKYKAFNTYCTHMVLATSGQIPQMLDNSIKFSKLVLTTSLIKNDKRYFLFQSFLH